MGSLTLDGTNSMEDQLQAPLDSADDLIDGVSYSDLLQQRREVLPMFLHRPDDTYLKYPDLGLELITFFSRSSNPYLDQVSGYSVAGREPEFERWETARKWALEKMIS